ncbi:DUF6194 family protein [Marinisporobacter balticus]|uniref:DUF6194 family protein n=1 Tax=Marinisporobacter balticus TaxID=2018667 RepID=UPI001042D8EF|nr:DUF6194 family protein [Marinisporobacter balticus]
MYAILKTQLRAQIFKELLGEIPKRPAAGDIVDMDYDFSELDKIIPHPTIEILLLVPVVHTEVNKDI